MAELLKALANANRLMILCALVKQPMTVGELSRVVPNITQSALSQHLALLKMHRILDFDKSGQSITYSIADHRVEEILYVLQEHYCPQVDDTMKAANSW